MADETLIIEEDDESPQSNFNNPLYGHHGEYTLSAGVALPYFSCLMPLGRVLGELKTAEQIPPSIDNEWSLRELFQREIDRDRVTKSIVKGYLSDPQKLKFFNAFTVVLMPKKDGKIASVFEPATDLPPAIPYDGKDKYDSNWAKEQFETTDLRGLQYTQQGRQARLRWDSAQVQATVVDGQHRLMALRVFKAEERDGTLTPEELQTKVPVLFVLLSKELGFTAVEGLGSVRSVSREIFTDLNKNARKVDRARELILDDWSLTARCVRRLVTDSATGDQPPKLPLSLIRWQEPNNRFDQSYYLNSLLQLESIVDEVLALATPADPMEKDDVLDFIDSVNTALGGGAELSAGGKTLKAVLEDDYCDPEDDQESTMRAPMARLPSAFLDAAVDAFENIHAPYVLRILTEFRPYAKLLHYARDNEMLSGSFGKYQAQTKHHKGKILEQKKAADPNWYDDNIKAHIEAIQRMKAWQDQDGIERIDWAFKTVFQKALMKLAKSVAVDWAADEGLGDVEKLLHYFNALHQGGAFEVHAPLDGHELEIWSFIATNPGGGKIKVNKKVETSIFHLLRLWYFQSLRLAQKGLSEEESSPSGALRYFSAKKHVSEWPGCAESVEILEGIFDSKLFFKAVHGKAKDDLAEKTRRNHVRSRMLGLLEAGRVTGA